MGSATTGTKRTVNIALALTGLNRATDLLVGVEHRREGRGLIISATMRTLGHADVATAQMVAKDDSQPVAPGV